MNTTAIQSAAIVAFALPALAQSAPARVERYAIYEATLAATGRYANPYTQLEAWAHVLRPDGAQWRIPLFWDGGDEWKVRVSPDLAGRWRYWIESSDAGLHGKQGSFDCIPSSRRGALRPMAGFPTHFQHQAGAPVWFMGDTAWGYFTDSAEDNHHRQQAYHYVDTRASQGFNVIHSMLMSEQGVGNQNGPPFEDIGAERINPRYWQEVDERLAYANGRGLSVGLVLAWGDKRKVEPFAWRRLPGVEARKRYARYIGARYSAYDVYFLVSGEWHAEIRTRDKATDEEVFREFIEIGNALDSADPHGRMIGIHPMSRMGSVREFAAAPWMSFGDYQQNYTDLHGRILFSRHTGRPVVNSEYGYHLRDADGDGAPDKSNSFSADDMRHASWDIAMAGGYLVTGFGTTYFAGHRDPGPFDVDAAKNDDWEAQISHIKRFFESVEWWRLVPADQLISCDALRTGDRTVKIRQQSGESNAVRPPQTVYWALTIPGETYIVYARGLSAPVRLELDCRPGMFRRRRFDPRSGIFAEQGTIPVSSRTEFHPPDARDWVYLLERIQQ